MLCDHDFQYRTNFGAASSKSFLCVAAPSFLRLDVSSAVLWFDSIHPPMELVMLDHYPLSKQVSPCFLENGLWFAEQVPGTNPLRLRKN